MQNRGSKKSRSRKIALAITIIFLGYIIFAYMNYVPFPYLNSTTNYPNSTYLASFDFSSVSNFIDEDDSKMDLIKNLHNSVEINIYGINGETGALVYTYIITIAEKDGWKTYTYGTGKSDTWEYAYHICTKGAMAMGHVIVSGSKVKKLTGHDVVYATAIADQLTLMRITG